MNLKLKWHLNKVLEGTLLLPLSLTGLLIAVCVMRTYKFYVYGVDLFPGLRGRDLLRLKDVLLVFWHVSLWPVLFWVPFALPLDLLIRRVVWRLHE